MFESLEDYWSFILEKAGALSMIIVPLPKEEQDAVLSSVREALGARAEGAIALPGLCVNASTRVPA